MSDQQLQEVLPAAQAGQAWALRAIHDQLAPKVQACLRARGASEPEDLTSEVFLTVFPRLPTVTGGAAGLRTFVFSVAHARLVDDLRRRSRREPVVTYEPERDTRVSASSEELVLAAVGTERVRRLLAGLVPDQRDVLALRVLGDPHGGAGCPSARQERGRRQAAAAPGAAGAAPHPGGRGGAPVTRTGDDLGVTRDLLSLDDRTVEALLSGREVDHEPLLSAFARQLLLSRDVEVVVPSAALAAILLDGLPAAQLHPAPAAPAGGTLRRRFRPAVALPALLSGAAAVVLLAASQNALPAPAQTAVADVVEAVTPLHVPRPAVAPLPAVSSPDPAAGSTGSTPDPADQPTGSATSRSGRTGRTPSTRRQGPPTRAARRPAAPRPTSPRPTSPAPGRAP